jgi:hypothetical protein
MLSSKPDGDSEVSMEIQVDTACSLNFMTNAFVHLMQNEPNVRTSILTASLYEIMGGEEMMRNMKDFSDVDEIINKVINKKK